MSTPIGSVGLRIEWAAALTTLERIAQTPDVVAAAGAQGPAAGAKPLTQVPRAQFDGSKQRGHRGYVESHAICDDAHVSSGQDDDAHSERSSRCGEGHGETPKNPWGCAWGAFHIRWPASSGRNP